jgi:hypothetical protein
MLRSSPLIKEHILNSLLFGGLLLVMTGCTGILFTDALRRGDKLSKEEIAAYESVGMVVVGCITANGPPPIGATTWLIFPKGQSLSGINFTDGCHLRQ